MPAAIIAVCNQKGGVGKTTIVTGLAEVYSQALSKRVLVIDADPQRNTTTAMGVTDPEFTLNDVLYGDESNNQKIMPGVAADAIMAAGKNWQANPDKDQNFPRLDLIASERNLASRERDSMMAREHRLRIALKGVAEAYDVVLIDCPPSLGLLTVNALTAATHALLVTEPRVASVDGLSEIVTTIAEVQENLNENIELVGVIINKERKGRSDQEHWISKVRTDFGDLVLDPMLPDREVFAKAQAASHPLRAFGSLTMPLRADLIQLAALILKGTEA
ncbi:ParA family protein (plasmid) [Pseudarthrobacter sp. P1]|uniref:ParA family protein n=1 Tax=Pseudarthrobacter sp. P1 TaxID=3418418 RepID=UPI003CE6B39D